MLINFMVGKCQNNFPRLGFKWMTDDDLDDCKHLNCIFEVDLEYPEQCHNLHNE